MVEQMHIITYHIIQRHKHFAFIFRCRYLPDLQFVTSQLADLQIKKRMLSHPFQRRERDSNPRYLSVRRFSRPMQSTTLPSLLK